jgi:tetratricopeptide (TPR) repeat protein
LRRFVRRHKGGVAAAMIALFGLCVGAYMTFDSMNSLNRANRQFAESNIENMLYLNLLENYVVFGSEPRNPNRTVREGLDQASKSVEACCQGRLRVEAKARKFLGVAYMDMGDDRSAETQLSKAVQLYRLVMDRDEDEGRFDEASLFAMSSLARLYASQKRFDEEEPLRVEVIERYRRHWSNNDVTRHNGTFALFDLANCYLNQARGQQAEATFAEVIQECRSQETTINQILSKEYLLSRSLAGHAQCLLAHNAFAEAEGELRECLSLMNREAPDSPDRVNADSLLAEALVRQRR